MLFRRAVGQEEEFAAPVALGELLVPGERARERCASVPALQVAGEHPLGDQLLPGETFHGTAL